MVGSDFGISVMKVEITIISLTLLLITLYHDLEFCRCPKNLTSDGFK